MSEIKVNKISPTSGGGTVTLATSGDTIAVPSGVTIANSGTATGFGGGKIGQVVSTTVTVATASTTSSTYNDITGMTLNITPAATTSKILVMFDINIGGQTSYSAKGQLVRDSTAIAVGDAASSRTVCSVDLRNTNDASQMIERSMSYLDSPSTTSQVTYKLQWRESENTTLYLNRSYSDVDDHRFGRAASTITAMEVLA